MKKIDIHCHTTKRKLKDTICVSAAPEHILEEMAKRDIERTILLATYFPARGTGISNFRLKSWIQDMPQFCMFGSLDFEHYFLQGVNEICELADNSEIAGIKIYCGYQSIDYASREFGNVVGIARKYSLPLMFHSGYVHQARRFPELPRAHNPKELESAIRDNEDVTFIISHLSNPYVDDLIQLVKTTGNVYSDTSGLFESFDEQHLVPQSIEYIKKFLGECGPERLMFGTDFPVQTHADSVMITEKAMVDFSDTEKEDVYYNNAMRLIF